MKKTTLLMLFAVLFIACARKGGQETTYSADALFQQGDSALLRAAEYSDSVEIH